MTPEQILESYSNGLFTVAEAAIKIIMIIDSFTSVTESSVKEVFNILQKEPVIEDEIRQIVLSWKDDSYFLECGTHPRRRSPDPATIEILKKIFS